MPWCVVTTIDLNADLGEGFGAVDPRPRDTPGAVELARSVRAALGAVSAFVDAAEDQR